MINLIRVKRQIAWQHQRALDAGIESTLSENDWIEVLVDCESKCFYCRKVIGENDLVIDHRSPITKGGGNTKANVVAACQRCNWRKGNRLSPDVENIEANRINEDEISVRLGGRRIRMFDREVEALIDTLKNALNTTFDLVNDLDNEKSTPTHRSTKPRTP